MRRFSFKGDSANNELSEIPALELDFRRCVSPCVVGMSERWRDRGVTRGGDAAAGAHAVI